MTKPERKNAMPKKLTDCPQCEGRGQVTLTVSEAGKNDKAYQMTCPTCRGAKKVSIEAAARLESFWCACGNPSGHSTYYADGENPECSKHCYACDDCGRILQVG